MYHPEDGRTLQRRNEENVTKLIRNFLPSHIGCKDLEYNLHLLQKPAFEVPNPLILSTIAHGNISNNVVVPINNDGSSHCDKENLHNFFVTYQKYILQDQYDYPDQVKAMWTIFTEFMGMYHTYCSNWATVNPVLPASTYIQNNQTELPAVAYHGNLIIDKAKGGRDEVRCVGHLGNSFPGCACIREGKGMVNMYQSTPTAVHVM